MGNCILHPAISTSTNEIIPVLPEDIIENIMLRLLIRSVMRLKCVCKSWRSLISSKYFINAHLRISSSNNNYSRHSVIFVDHMMTQTPSLNKAPLSCFMDGVRVNPILFSLPKCKENYCTIPAKGYKDDVSFIGFDQIQIVGCCNGIACIIVDEKYLCLWNPSMRKFKRLPNMRPSMYQNIPIPCYGFGFDEVNDDYMVVCITGKISELSMMVYSLNYNYWKHTDYISMRPHMIEGRARYAKNKLYWLMLPHKELTRINVIAYDLSTAIWENIELPDFSRYGLGYKSMLAVLDGDLYVVWDFSIAGADFWILRQHGENKSWYKMFRIPKDSTNEPQIPMELFRGPNGEVSWWSSRKKTINMYDLSDNTCREIKFLNLDISGIDVCIESLVELV